MGVIPAGCPCRLHSRRAGVHRHQESAEQPGQYRLMTTFQADRPGCALHWHRPPQIRLRFRLAVQPSHGGSDPMASATAWDPCLRNDITGHLRRNQHRTDCGHRSISCVMLGPSFRRPPTAVLSRADVRAGRPRQVCRLLIRRLHSQPADAETFTAATGEM